ncbi:MAG: dethiobiotin synthase [Pedobacter sp.]|nr:MAG: dethiobiotin synthase [Pedobacter sp.]
MNAKKPLFITGIGTGIGKTVVAAILTEALKADYWKPVQSGELENTDSHTIGRLISNSSTVIHPEIYRLTEPLSPHRSAIIDGIHINKEDFTLPDTGNNLIIEGAGGLMVPLNENFLVADLISHLQTEAILVSRHYLGSINHTLLSACLLKLKGIPVKGIIFSGDVNRSSEEFILNYTGLSLLGYVPELGVIDKEQIRKCGDGIDLGA